MFSQTKSKVMHFFLLFDRMNNSFTSKQNINWRPFALKSTNLIMKAEFTLSFTSKAFIKETKSVNASRRHWGY